MWLPSLPSAVLSYRCLLCLLFRLLQIMRYVRHLKLQPGYDPNTTHVVYGQVCCLVVKEALSNALEVGLLHANNNTSARQHVGHPA